MQLWVVGRTAGSASPASLLLLLRSSQSAPPPPPSLVRHFSAVVGQARAALAAPRQGRWAAAAAAERNSSCGGGATKFCRRFTKSPPPPPRTIIGRYLSTTTSACDKVNPVGKDYGELRSMSYVEGGRRYFFDLKENDDSGRFVKISETSNGKRSTLVIPFVDARKLWSDLEGVREEMTATRESEEQPQQRQDNRLVATLFYESNKNKHMDVSLCHNAHGRFLILTEVHLSDDRNADGTTRGRIFVSEEAVAGFVHTLGLVCSDSGAAVDGAAAAAQTRTGGGGTERPGDWTCPDCNTLNFARRTECFKCRLPKDTKWNHGLPYWPEETAESSSSSETSRDDRAAAAAMTPPPPPPPATTTTTPAASIDMRPGDWLCPQCKIHNFARRYKCFKCGHRRELNGDEQPPTAAGLTWFA